MSGSLSNLYTLRGTSMKTGQVGDARQTKQRLYNIPVTVAHVT
jgi:hypothetical protein